MHDWRDVICEAMMVLLLLIGGAGCSQPDQQEVSETQEGQLVLGQSEVVERVQRAVAPGERLLVLSGFNGTVRLDGTDSEVAQLTFEKRARGQDDAAAREVLEGIQLTERGNASRYEYVMRSKQPDRSEVDVHGTVPHDTQLRVDFESGAVALSGVEGPIEVMHQSGNVQIAGAGASVRVEIRNGDIQVGMQEVPQGAHVGMTTSNGSLTLMVPSTASAQITAQTQAGEVSMQDLRFESRRLEPQGAGARFEAQLGTGNATIDLRTENGAVVLRGGRAETPIPADSMDVEPPDSVMAPPSSTVPPETTDTSTMDTSAAPPDTVSMDDG